MPTAQRASSDGGGSFAEISSFFKEHREAAKAERAELEARLDANATDDCRIAIFVVAQRGARKQHNGDAHGKLLYMPLLVFWKT